MECSRLLIDSPSEHYRIHECMACQSMAISDSLNVPSNIGGRFITYMVQRLRLSAKLIRAIHRYIRTVDPSKLAGPAKLLHRASFEPVP